MTRILGSDAAATVLGQDIYAISATQKHRLGTRVVRGDSVYRYAKAGAAITNNQMALHPQSFREVRGAVIPTNGGRAIGATDVLITVNAADGFASEGNAGDGEILVHSLEGGHIILVPQGYGVNNWLTFGILDNTVVAAGGGTMTVTLDGELPTAMVAATAWHEEVLGNMYLNVVGGNNVDVCPHVGMAMRLLTVAEPYGWLKTWGPMRVAPQSGVGVPTGPFEPKSQVVFRYDGSVQTQTTAVQNRYCQMAGYTMSSTGSAGGYGQSAPFIFLQISP